MGDFCSHDTARLDRDRILDGHGVCQKLNCADPVLNIGALQTLICIGEGRIDLILYIAGLIDQIHQLADEDIPFSVHQVVALSGKCE